MAFKLTIALALFSLASAALVPAGQVYHAAPAAVIHHEATPVITKSSEEYDPNPQYKFSYDVQDAISGDSKSQSEQRDGDVVQGEYSLTDSDGYKRTVQYTADPINGFNAVVHREPLVNSVAVKSATPAVSYSSAPATLIKSHPVTYTSSPAQYHYASSPAQYHYASSPAQYHYASSPDQFHYAVAPGQVHYSAPAAYYHH